MIVLATAAYAAEWTVGVDAATIAETVTLAASGDTIEVPEGVWPGCVDTAGKSLTLRGAGTLDGSGCDATVRIAAGEAVALEGLTLTNPDGRALHAEWSAVSLDAVTIADSGRTDASGGGIWAYGASLTTNMCVFAGNEASEGGAVYLYAYTTWSDVGSTFTANAAGGSGGAVMAYYDNVVAFDGATFEANVAGYYGGAVATWDYTDLSVGGTSFRENTSATGGGALFYYPVDSTAGVLDVEGSTFVGNVGPDGGGLWIGWANQATLRGNTLTGNTASGSGGAVLAYVSTSTTLVGNTFCGNTAATGGAVSVQWTGVDTWANNVFVANTATNGGAAHRYASYAGSMLQNTFAGNEATAWGGAYHASWAYADFRNNIVADTPSGTGIYTAEAATEASSPVTYSGWWSNAVADGSGYFWVDDAGGNVVTDDPGFVAWDGSCGADLRLLGASPWKDAGDPTILDRDGTRSDMGAWGGPDAPVEDADGDGLDTTRDCDDTTADRGPGAAEACNGVDDDCDGRVDEDATDALPWFTDADGDGFGDPASPVDACDAPDGAVANNRDCDDAERWVNPDASDLPGDGVDADCSGADNVQLVPEGAPDAEPPDDGCGCRGSAGGVGSVGWGLVLLAATLARRAATTALPSSR